MTTESKNPAASGDGSMPANLTGRLLYLFILLRHSDARMGHGRKRAAAIYEGQGRVLRMLQLQSPIAQKELAYLMGIRPQSLSELISKLEQANLVRRVPNPDDRRTAIVEITDQGRAAAEQQEQAFDVDQTFGLDANDMTTLTQLLDKVIANIESRIPGGIDRRFERFRRTWIESEGR